MSNKSGSNEEKFPLLFLFLEDGQRSNKQFKKLSFDKGRYQGIASGASSVMTQWPGHVASCWISATLIGITFLFVSMMTIMFTINPGLQNLTTKCKSDYATLSHNETSVIYLVHDQMRWTTSQLDALKGIAQNNPQSNITLILIKYEVDPFIMVNKRKLESSTTSTTSRLVYPRKIIVKRSAATTQKPNTKIEIKKFTTLKSIKDATLPPNTKIPYPGKTLELSINVGAKELINMLLKRSEKFKPKSITKKVTLRAQTLQNVLNDCQNIKLMSTTYERIFKQTPLYLFWQNTNIDTRLFAIRVLQLWNNAGSSFALPTGEETVREAEYINFSNINTTPFPGFLNNKHSIKVGPSKLSTGLVTIDDEGFYMETKTICHAFFGEMLVSLAKSNINTKPANVIRTVLQIFCAKGAVNGDYCRMING